MKAVLKQIALVMATSRNALAVDPSGVTIAGVTVRFVMLGFAAQSAVVSGLIFVMYVEKRSVKHVGTKKMENAPFCFAGNVMQFFVMAAISNTMVLFHTANAENKFAYCGDLC